MICQKKQIRLRAQEKVAIDEIHPQYKGLAVLLEADEQLATNLERWSSVRSALDHTGQGCPQLADIRE
jgi:hypothetical protein